jgi:hypothetical protein
MTIAVEDWDELAEPRRRRDKRAKGEAAPVQPAATPAQPAAPPAHAGSPAPPAQRQAARVPSGASGLRSRVQAAEPALIAVAEPEPEAERVPGVAVFADDDYGDAMQNLRLPAGIAGGNLLVWLVGLLTGVVQLVGVAFFVSVGLLLAAYMLREWQRDRMALLCFAGALPLPITIIGFFT